MKDIPLLSRAFHLLGAKEISQKILEYSYFLQFVTNNICTTDIQLTKELYSPDIQEAIHYIHIHLMEDLSIEIIAANCGLSASRFKGKFKEELGITPYAYITSLKIDTAKILLKNPDTSITEVAYQLNFSSSNHFSSVFKQYTGCTPTYFRHHRFANIY